MVRYLKRGSRRTQSAGICPIWFLAHGFFFPEDGGGTFLQNVGSHKIYKALHPRRRYSSNTKKLAKSIKDTPKQISI
jgi:hypothetical protein